MNDNKTETTKPEAPKIIKLLYREKELVELIGVSRSTIWKWIKTKNFPKPFKIGACTFWKAQEILAFLNQIGG